MGYIKEPIGIDLNVGPMPFSDEDRQEISAIIAQYKNTGEIPKLTRKPKSKRRKSVAITDATRARVKPTSLKKKPSVSGLDKL